MICDDVLDAVGNTPLIRINNITKKAGIQCEILAKCEFLNPMGSAKDRVGRRMVLETIQDLRKYHYEVTECLVVFEPQQKDARKKLEQQNVNLLSICKTHED